MDLTDTKCAFTPDANEALRANYLHIKSLQRLDRQSCSAIRANEAARITCSDVITSGGRKSETTMEDKLIVVVCGYPELYDTTSYFYKILQWDWSCLAEAPPMTRIRICCVLNFTCEWCEFHARMKQLNSKCSSAQLCANSVIYSLHSRLVWIHLKCPDSLSSFHRLLQVNSMRGLM